MQTRKVVALTGDVVALLEYDRDAKLSFFESLRLVIMQAGSTDYPAQSVEIRGHDVETLATFLYAIVARPITKNG